MPNNLYVTATEERSGKSVIVLGIMQMLINQLHRVAFFRPIISDQIEEKQDHDITLILDYFKVEQDYETCFGCTLKTAYEMINSGHEDDLHDLILKKYRDVADYHDFVLIEGTDFRGQDTTFESEINGDIAANLGAPVVLVSSGRKKTVDEMIRQVQVSIDSHKEKGLILVSSIINRAPEGLTSKILSDIRNKYHPDEELPFYVIPENPALANPTVGDVNRWLNGSVMYGSAGLNTVVGDYVVAAMRVENFLEYLTPGCLVITPGDRHDIILASLSARSSTSYPEVSGIVLTGGLVPSDNVRRLIDGWSGRPIPIICVKGHTYLVVQQLYELYGHIEPGDQTRIATALGNFSKYVNMVELRKNVITDRPARITPKMFEYSLLERAAESRQRIVLPEGNCERILRAADILLRRGVADLTILGREDQVRALATANGLDLTWVEVIDPQTSSMLEDFVQTYLSLRQHRGVIEDMARDRMSDTTYFGTMMVYKGFADGMVSGALNTTAHTVRPAFEFIKAKPGFTIVSSVFLMCLRDRILVYGDCAVNPNPDASQLAEIALSSAETARTFGIEPRVAMLSYSTGASGKGEDVERVAEATHIAQNLIRERKLDFVLEGPLQYDAAIDPEVARTKMPGSAVAGRATVFIFPDLNTGNNTYKAVQRAANAVAIGPVLQGLNKPVNDLSRGCTIDDIVNTVAITAIQAQAEDV
ncbi:MAG: phosphate acetyltransferase [Desulfofustis sp.]|nr:phosphate acetyltransferase [Desulfofustis sp.]NNK58676.1 phosphate acetyltransferase [Desulfofustis sp.]